jgi:hypothetical protein
MRNEEEEEEEEDTCEGRAGSRRALKARRRK